MPTDDERYNIVTKFKREIDALTAEKAVIEWGKWYERVDQPWITEYGDPTGFPCICINNETSERSDFLITGYTEQIKHYAAEKV